MILRDFGVIAILGMVTFSLATVGVTEKRNHAIREEKRHKSRVFICDLESSQCIKHEVKGG